MKHQYHLVRKGSKIGTIICKRRGCQLELPRGYPGHLKPRSGCPTIVTEHITSDIGQTIKPVRLYR